MIGHAQVVECLKMASKCRDIIHNPMLLHADCFKRLSCEVSLNLYTRSLHIKLDVYVANSLLFPSDLQYVSINIDMD